MMNHLLYGALALTAPLLGEPTKVLAIAGSTREGSFNKKLLQEAVAMSRGMGAKVTVIDLKDYPMPFYDADLERNQGMPQNAKRIRDLMIASDAVLIASPEYNASLPAVLKNTIDWASRSEDGKSSREAFKGKKFAIMSASPGQGGGARSLAHLRAVIKDIGGEVLELQVSIPQAHNAFDAEGHLSQGPLMQALQSEIQQLLTAKAAN
jgi:chromate reductase, NAD(P)H dehydrogenase (quinone)